MPHRAEVHHPTHRDRRDVLAERLAALEHGKQLRTAERPRRAPEADRALGVHWKEAHGIPGAIRRDDLRRDRLDVSGPSQLEAGRGMYGEPNGFPVAGIGPCASPPGRSLGVLAFDDQARDAAQSLDLRDPLRIGAGESRGLEGGRAKGAHLDLCHRGLRVRRHDVNGHGARVVPLGLDRACRQIDGPLARPLLHAEVVPDDRGLGANAEPLVEVLPVRGTERPVLAWLGLRAAIPGTQVPLLLHGAVERAHLDGHTPASPVGGLRALLHATGIGLFRRRPFRRVPRAVVRRRLGRCDRAAATTAWPDAGQPAVQLPEQDQDQQRDQYPEQTAQRRTALLAHAQRLPGRGAGYLKSLAQAVPA